MINKWMASLVVLALFLILASSGYISQGNTEMRTLVATERAYILREPIRINSNTEFDNMAQQESWSGTGGYLSPYIIENYEINGHGAPALYIGNTSRYFILRYSHLYNLTHAGGTYNRGVVEFYKVQNGEVYGCNITHGQYGIYIATHSSENKVEYNEFYNVTNGVYLYFYTTQTSVTNNEFHYGVHVGTAITISYYSDDNSVWYNTIDGPSAGVYITGQIGDCTNNQISRNIISNTRDYGVYTYSSSDNRVENNTIRYSMNVGIRAYLASNILIVNNSISHSSGYGIRADNTDGALIYNNSLWGNNGATDTYDSSHVQAFNNGSNQWYYKNHGNYWADWANNNDTNDQNHDGIVDWHYKLDGDEGSEDPYPLKESSVPIPEMNPQIMVIILLIGIAYLVRKR